MNKLIGLIEKGKHPLLIYLYLDCLCAKCLGFPLV